MSGIINIQTTSPKHNVSIDQYITECKDIIEKRHVDWLTSIVEKLKIKNRQCILNLNSYKDIVDLPIHIKSDIYKDEVMKLVSENLTSLFNSSVVDQKEITHVISVSCTGVFTPGIEHQIIDLFSLNQNTWCVGLNFMGCHGAMKALFLADQIVKSSNNSKVLIVCVELCSLHMQKSTSKTTLIANSLFADGCASCIVGKAEESIFSMNDFNTVRVPNTQKDITWNMGEKAFDMFMDKNVNKSIMAFVKQLFSKSPNIDHHQLTYCIHPGGVSIMEAICYQLGLDHSKLDYSYDVLRNHGNMSSPTLLFVLDNILKNCKDTNDIAMIGAGPGISLETFRLKWVKQNDFFTNRSTKKEIMDGPYTNLYTPKVRDDTNLLLQKVHKYLFRLITDISKNITEMENNHNIANNNRHTVGDFVHNNRHTVGDFGCGDGYLIKELAKLHPNVEFVGFDIDSQLVDKNTSKNKLPNLAFQTIKSINDIPTGVSMIISTMTMHHLTDKEIVDFLKKANEKVTNSVLVYDLHRSKITSLLWKLAKPFSHPVSYIDGAISIERAFTKDDLILFTKKAEIKPECVNLSWRLPFVWKLKIDKTCTNITKMNRSQYITEDHKDTHYVKHMFNVIAPKYDFMTKISSCGSDSKWKVKMLHEIPEDTNINVLDLATGNGCIAFDIASKCGPKSKILAIDLSDGMIKEANRLKPTRNGSEKIEFVCDDVMNLKVLDNSIDYVTAGYAFRNFPSCDKSLDLITKTLKPKGKIIILDFYKPSNKVWKFVWLWALFIWTSFLGIMLHGDAKYYNYICDSIKTYISIEQMNEKLRKRNYKINKVHRVWFGAMAVQVATKQEQQESLNSKEEVS
jgi:alpha-pyrone synthase